jgi:hypothetical protein
MHLSYHVPRPVKKTQPNEASTQTKVALLLASPQIGPIQIPGEHGWSTTRALLRAWARWCAPTCRAETATNPSTPDTASQSRRAPRSSSGARHAPRRIPLTAQSLRFEHRASRARRQQFRAVSGRALFCARKPSSPDRGSGEHRGAFVGHAWAHGAGRATRESPTLSPRPLLGGSLAWEGPHYATAGPKCARLCAAEPTQALRASLPTRAELRWRTHSWIRFLPRNGFTASPHRSPPAFAVSVRRASSRQKPGCSRSGGFAAGELELARRRKAVRSAWPHGAPVEHTVERCVAHQAPHRAKSLAFT